MDSALVEVLVDLHLAASLPAATDSVDPGLRARVLARHGYDEATFHARMDRYAEHPDAYLALYDEVLDRLNEERLF